MITTQQELRTAFWQSHPRLVYRPGKTQNDYPADTRMDWCDYIDHMHRDGQIDTSLASRAVL